MMLHFSGWYKNPIVYRIDTFYFECSYGFGPYVLTCMVWCKLYKYPHKPLGCFTMTKFTNKSLVMFSNSNLAQIKVA